MNEEGDVSVELVKKAMLKFLADPTPEVLCIEGKWGTGKTYAWGDAVRQAASAKAMHITKYAYVSLFGLNNPSDIVQSVFANTNDLSVIGDNSHLPTALGGVRSPIFLRS
jgi:Cdc6-like AAA superfamily ATPase